MGVLVGFFDADSAESKALTEVAEANRETVVIGQVQDKEVKVDGTEYGKLYMFRDFGEPLVAYGGDISFDGITEFLNAERFPLIDAIGPENYKDYVDRGLPLVWISLNVDDEDEKKNVIDALTPYAEANKGKLSFTWVDAAKYAQHVQNLGITQTPGILIAGDDNKKFLFDGKVTDADALKTYFDGYSAGTLQAHLKSEAVPETNDEPVYVLVGSEFESVIIAKVDATENDTPEDIKGFPTLIFYKKGSMEGTKYDGDRKQDAIIEWIKENASGDVSKVKTEL